YPAILRAIRRTSEMAREPATATSERETPSFPTEPPGPPRPWDMTPADERNWFDLLGDGLVVYLDVEDVPPWIWSSSGGAWIHVDPAGYATAFIGKVDVGQGNSRSLGMTVAAELGVPIERVRMVMGDTDLCPFDMGTFGSRSTPDAGSLLASVASAAGEILESNPVERGQRRVEKVRFSSRPRRRISEQPRFADADALDGSRAFTSDLRD